MQFEEKLLNCRVTFDTGAHSNLADVESISIEITWHNLYNNRDTSIYKMQLHTNKLTNTEILKQLSEDISYDLLGLVCKLEPLLGVPYKHYSIMSREDIPWWDIPEVIMFEVTHYCPTFEWIKHVDGLWFFWSYGWRELPERFIRSEYIEKRPSIDL